MVAVRSALSGERLEEAIKQADTKYNEKTNKEGYVTNINSISISLITEDELTEWLMY